MFRELFLAAADEIGAIGFCNADTGFAEIPHLKLMTAPPFRSSSAIARLSSWMGYFVIGGWRALTEPGKPLLFIVTNPPMMPIIGWLAKKVKRQRYALLFYDMYPEALVRFGGISDRSIIAKGWRLLNRVSVRNADRVITLSPRLTQTLSQYYSEDGSMHNVQIVPTWVDAEYIRPIPKHENWFARQYDQVTKLTILYSGNIGATHDLSTLVEVADRLRPHTDIHLLVISNSPGRKSLEGECTERDLTNITFLARQDEATLPYSLASADIAIVALAEGAEGISMPSKAYYMMGAGNALLGLSNPNSDLAAVIRDYQCGINVRPGDVEETVRAIMKWYNQPEYLRDCQKRARQAVERSFSREICVPQMLGTIMPLL
jgi:glycosyltransferase involved in cell wall biosynthesis